MVRTVVRLSKDVFEFVAIVRLCVCVFGAPFNAWREAAVYRAASHNDGIKGGRGKKQTHKREEGKWGVEAHELALRVSTLPLPPFCSSFAMHGEADRRTERTRQGPCNDGREQEGKKNGVSLELISKAQKRRKRNGRKREENKGSEKEKHK